MKNEGDTADKSSDSVVGSRTYPPMDVTYIIYPLLSCGAAVEGGRAALVHFVWHCLLRCTEAPEKPAHALRHANLDTLPAIAVS